MSNINLTFCNLSAGQAVTLIQAAGNAGAAPSVTAVMPTGNVSAPAAMPPPVGMPAPSASVPAPVPATAPVPSPAPGGAATDVLAAMQEYVKVHKSSGVKALLGLCGLTRLPDANAEQQAWLLQAFNSKQPPSAFGAPA